MTNGSGRRVLYRACPAASGPFSRLLCACDISRSALTNARRPCRTRSPAVGASPHIQAIPAEVGAGAAAIGHRVVGRQVDTTHPAGRDHGRFPPARGQTLSITHDQLTSRPQSVAIPEGPANGQEGKPGIAEGPTTVPRSLAR